MQATVTWIEHDAEFLQLGDEWQALFLASGESSPFLSWPWIRTWWQCFKGESRLCVLACRDQDGRLTGIAPLLIAKRKSFAAITVRTVEFLGNRGSAVCVDHLDFLTLPQGRDVIVRCLVEALFRHRAQWDVLALASVSETSAIPAALAERLAREQGLFVIGEEEICPWMPLPATWDLFVEQMKREHKSLISNLRRKRNRLHAEHTVEFFAGPAVGDANRHVETLAELHRLARMRQGGEGNFALIEYRRFHDRVVRAAEEQNALYLARLDIDGKPAAAWYGFYSAPVLSYYQSGFDTQYVKEGVGDVLLGYILEDAITRLGATGFDFLRGTEEYKFRWTHQVRTDRTLLYWSHHLPGHLAKSEYRLRRRASAWKGAWMAKREAAAKKKAGKPAPPAAAE